MVIILPSEQRRPGVSAATGVNFPVQVGRLVCSLISPAVAQ